MSDCKVVLEICLTALVNESRTQIVLGFFASGSGFYCAAAVSHLYSTF